MTNTPANGISAQNNALTGTASQAANPLDQLSSADIAVHIARMANLDETVSVVNHADSVNAQLAVSPVDEAVAPKPQIVTSSLKSKQDIEAYEVKSGDTLSAVAKMFGVTSESIRWSNDLGSGELLEAGSTLQIPPVDGIVYKVEGGDTIDSLAEKFSADKQKLTEMNDAEIAGLKENELIIIPGGVQPAPPTYAASSYSSFSGGGGGFSFGASAVYGYNAYVPGYCTYYVASRVSVPANWGNARTWALGARRSPGWTVSTAPRAGSIAQTASMNYLGHVAYVEEVSEDGSMIKYSDMNGIAGFGRVGYSGWAPASQFDYYIYR